MQVAEILSDITSLRVCGHNEALSLVNANQSLADTSATEISNSSTVNASHDTQLNNKQDHLRRAKELVKLHYEFKSRHSDGEVDSALQKSREDVEQVLAELA
ncbi:hypothetical protein N7466_005524 [Penicillium verhagenii]|uniref:uncharacterized protein n=1 Tax=Penicillium verhagenii TaxID=1562060 RepID=UPI002544E3BD|nr:uncharacterized protein N7466_005524 [Penicillium verhagenii]KAJ5930031.1 hypothetical protein N7466_005524 [Penicillium verhagenii]